MIKLGSVDFEVLAWALVKDYRPNAAKLLVNNKQLDSVVWC